MRVSFVAARVGAVGVAMLAATTVSGRAQTEYWPQVERELSTGLFGRPAVVGAPFAAEAVTTWTPPPFSGVGVHRATTRMYRTRDGRARVEQTFAGQTGTRPQQVYVLADPADGETWALDPAARTASRHAAGHTRMVTPNLAQVMIPVTAHCAIAFIRPQTVQLYREGGYAEDDLGQQSIAGAPAVGRRFAGEVLWSGDGPPRAVSEEHWVSPELRLVLRSRSEDALIGVVEHVVTRLSLAEPPDDLFVVPADYVPGAPFSHYGWENPRALMTWRRGAAPCSLPIVP